MDSVNTFFKSSSIKGGDALIGEIVQEGVYRELSCGVKRYIDHIWYLVHALVEVEGRKERVTEKVNRRYAYDGCSVVC